MSNPVFYAAPEQLAGLGPGAQFTLDGAEGRHATTVKRLAVGEAVDLSDGDGLRLVCTVANAGKGILTVTVVEAISEPRPSRTLTLVQGLAKGDRDELAIEMATELGIDAVVPWQAQRSIVRWKLDKAVKGPEKWRQVVAAAAKQARRATIPQVAELARTAEICARIAAAELALILHEDATDSLAAVASNWQQQDRSGQSGQQAGQTQEILMIVGPEGGISPAEVEAFLAAGARLALLGHHVLRSSTAGPAAVVLLNHELGRWG